MTKFDRAFVAAGFQEFRLMDETNCLEQIFKDVVCIEIGKDHYFLPNGQKYRVVDEDSSYESIRKDYDAHEQLKKVQERGFVNLDYWVKIDEPPSLQEMLDYEWVLEQEDRRDWAA